MHYSFMIKEKACSYSAKGRVDVQKLTQCYQMCTSWKICMWPAYFHGLHWLMHVCMCACVCSCWGRHKGMGDLAGLRTPKSLPESTNSTSFSPLSLSLSLSLILSPKTSPAKMLSQRIKHSALSLSFFLSASPFFLSFFLSFSFFLCFFIFPVLPFIIGKHIGCQHFWMATCACACVSECVRWLKPACGLIRVNNLRADCGI